MVLPSSEQPTEQTRLEVWVTRKGIDVRREGKAYVERQSHGSKLERPVFFV